MAEALSGAVSEMAEFIQRALEDLPSRTAEEVVRRGIVLTGGGALLDRLDQALARLVGVEFVVPESPMHCVIKGTATVLEQIGERQHLLIGP
jgi:rod shape-determining protein MreB